MTLPSKILQFPFSQGLSEILDPKTAPPGALIRAENVIWHKTGRLEKRFGTRALSPAQVSGKRIFTRGSELCVIDGQVLSAWSPAIGAWRPVDRVGEVGLTWDSLTDTYNGVSSSDIALSTSGMLVHAWTTGDPTDTTTTGQLYVQIVDRKSGTQLLSPVLVAGPVPYGVRVLIMGTLAFVIWRDAGTIFGQIVNLTTFSLSGTPVALRVDATLVGSQLGWDAIVVNEVALARIVIAYETTAAAPSLVLYAFDSTLVQTAAGGVTSELGNTFSTIGIACPAFPIAGDTIFVAYYDDSVGDLQYATVDKTTLAEVLAPVSLETPVVVDTVSICMRRDDPADAVRDAVIVYTTRFQSPTDQQRTSSILVTDAGVTAVPRGTYFTTLCCRPFRMNGHCYVTLCESEPNTFSSVFTGANVYLVEVDTVPETGETKFTPHRLIGKIDTLIGARPGYRAPPPSPAVSVLAAVPLAGEGRSAVQCVFPSFFLAIAPTTFDVWRTGLRLVSASIKEALSADMWRTVSYDQDAYLVAGMLQAYDGRSVFDYCFTRSPVFLSSITTNPAGAIVVGDYVYTLGLEYRAATGTLHRSPLATLPNVFGIGATPSSVQFFIFGTSVGCKQNLASGFFGSTPRAVLFALNRSIVGGTVPQRITLEPTAAFQTQLNDPRVCIQSLFDGRADANITNLAPAVPLATRPAAYTVGGILDDNQPVGGVTMFLHKSRMWHLAGDRKSWWYSKSFQDDIGVAPGFHPDFRVIFDETQTCGASLDEKAIFFSASSIAFLQGEGPAPDGTGSDYGAPTRIQTDSGCTNPRSVISMPDGVIFQGFNGNLYILDRGLQVDWIGKSVQDKLTDFPIITSAVLLNDHNEVRFSCNNLAGTEGRVLVYNYFEKLWSVLIYTSAEGLGKAIADACLWEGNYTFITASGEVFTEDPSTYLDRGQDWVTIDVETAEIFAEGPLSYQLVRWTYIRAEVLGECGITMRVAVNGMATYDQVKSWTSAELVALGPAARGVGVHVRRQRSASIRVRIQDSGVGGGFEVLTTAITAMAPAAWYQAPDYVGDPWTHDPAIVGAGTDPLYVFANFIGLDIRTTSSWPDRSVNARTLTPNPFAPNPFRIPFSGSVGVGAPPLTWAFPASIPGSPHFVGPSGGGGMQNAASPLTLWAGTGDHHLFASFYPGPGPDLTFVEPGDMVFGAGAAPGGADISAWTRILADDANVLGLCIARFPAANLPGGPYTYWAGIFEWDGAYRSAKVEITSVFSGTFGGTYGYQDLSGAAGNGLVTLQGKKEGGFLWVRLGTGPWIVGDACGVTGAGFGNINVGGSTGVSADFEGVINAIITWDRVLTPTESDLLATFGPSTVTGRSVELSAIGFDIAPMAGIDHRGPKARK
jgi:hypothetical protein